MSTLKERSWVPPHCETLVQSYAAQTNKESSADTVQRIEALTQRNSEIHERDCFNLNPATNVMNPRAEALLAQRLGRPSLGYPGDKYETGLEAIEEIEVITAQLSAEIFQADYAEIRVPSGAISNLYAFMATCRPGDTVIVPPASIGGHVTHHDAGCAGLFGLDIHSAPVNADGYSVDVDALRTMAIRLQPKLITIGGSLNLFEHPVRALREVADEVGAKLLFDAAHQCGLIAGKAWANPLSEGAHLMTMSTYKSLAGPVGGLIVSNDAEIAEKLDRIAYPGMTANFDAAKSAALAVTLLDWRDHGRAYAKAMVDVAQVFATTLDAHGIAVFAKQQGFTQSHQFAVDARAFGGGQSASKALREAGFLACGIGLPIEPGPVMAKGDTTGLRLGTPELVRWGANESNIVEIATLVARALTANSPAQMAHEVAELRAGFDQLHFLTP